MLLGQAGSGSADGSLGGGGKAGRPALLQTCGPSVGVQGWRTAIFQEHLKLLQLRGGAGHPHFNTSGKRAQFWCPSVLVRDERDGSFAAFSDQAPFPIEIRYSMVKTSSELPCGSPSRQAEGLSALQGLPGFQAPEVGACGFGWGWGMGQGTFRSLDRHCPPVPE